MYKHTDAHINIHINKYTHMRVAHNGTVSLFIVVVVFSQLAFSLDHVGVFPTQPDMEAALASPAVENRPKHALSGQEVQPPCLCFCSRGHICVSTI